MRHMRHGGSKSAHASPMRHAVKTTNGLRTIVKLSTKTIKYASYAEYFD